MDLNDLAVFSEVVERSGFSAAARMLGLPTSTVSRRIGRLEDALGVRLLHRTTRKLSLTDAGRVLYGHCTRLSAEIADAKRALDALGEVPKGRVRMTAPPDLGEHLWSMIARFLRTFPEVDVELVLTELVLDLVAEGIDVAVRGGARPSGNTLIAKRVGEAPRLLLAAPAYLRERGMPTRPEDLAEHDCVLYRGFANQGQWALSQGARKVTVTVRGRMSANQLDVVKRAVLEGFGIGQLLAHLTVDEVRQERLVTVLPTWSLGRGGVWILFPSKRHQVPAVRALIDFLSEELVTFGPSSDATPG